MSSKRLPKETQIRILTGEMPNGLLFQYEGVCKFDELFDVSENAVVLRIEEVGLSNYFKTSGNSDGIHFRQSGSCFEVFDMERGVVFERKDFSRKREAIEYIVGRRFSSIRNWLDAAFRSRKNPRK